MGKPRRIMPTGNWEQLQLFITSPEQARYEEIRPIVLFGQPPGARSCETGTPAHILRRRVNRFTAHQWVGDFNYQVHYAHIKRDDNRHSPAEVLGWVRGRLVDDATLHRVFHTTRFVRHLDRGGYLQFRHGRMYAEQGLARQPAALWLYAEKQSSSTVTLLSTQIRTTENRRQKHPCWLITAPASVNLAAVEMSRLLAARR